ncbi:MAG: FAD-binding protein [Paracoccus sp. (in: a-proteobacteria)]|nr:FAD-binding protein [Paracoccus sp. (in: a-proteobacteria)]
MAPRTEAELAAHIADCAGQGTPVRIIGGGTRGMVPSATLTTRELTGIVTYEPGELTLIARAGTPVRDIEATLAAQGQALAFEPADHCALLGGDGPATIGGVVAANVSGPRRILAGACRDHLLGVRFVDGQGRIIKNGGRVMKNVTGMDLVKLMAGSYGTLGVLTEIVLKTLPRAPAQQTLAFAAMPPAQAVTLFSAALATPFEVSGAAWQGGTAWLRIEGLPAQLAYRRDRLAAQFADLRPGVLDDAESRDLWQDLRDIRHFAKASAPVWRIFVKPTDAPQVMDRLTRQGGAVSMDWGGGLIWYCGTADPNDSGIRATRLRGGARLAPASSGAAGLARHLRKTFDPAGILNPGLMER